MRPLRHVAEEQVIYRGPDASRAFTVATEILFSLRFYAPMVVPLHAIPAGQIVEGLAMDLCAKVGPLRLRGPVRVVRVWDEEGITFRSAGFTYEALPGHPERGVASFAVIRRGDEVQMRQATDSAPDRWYSILGAPLARRVQRKAVSHAFRHMRELLSAELERPSTSGPPQPSAPATR